MKFIQLLLSVAFVLLSISPSNSQPFNWEDTEIFVQGGIAQPVAPQEFRGYWTGYRIGGGAEVPISNTITLRPSVTYTRFLFQEKAYLSDIDYQYGGTVVVGPDTRYAGFIATLDLLVDVFSSWEYGSPYTVAGVGFYRWNPNIAIRSNGPVLPDPGVGSGHQLAFNLNGGIGLQKNISSNVAAFIETKLVVGFVNYKREGRPMDINMKLPASIGITYSI